MIPAQFFGSFFWPLLKLAIECGSLLFKLFIMYKLYVRLSSKNKLFWSLISILLCGIITNITLIAFGLGCEPFSFLSPSFMHALVQVEHAALCLQIYSMLLFCAAFSSLKITTGVRSLTFFSFYTYLSVFVFSLLSIDYFLLGDLLNTYLEGLTRSFYFLWSILLFSEGLCALGIIYQNYRKEPLNLMRYHMYLLMLFYIVPYLIMKIFEFSLPSGIYHPYPSNETFSSSPATFSSIGLIIITAYCARKLSMSRFLNIDTHVRSYKRGGILLFARDFKEVCNQLRAVYTMQAACPIIRAFFTKIFSVPSKYISIILHGKNIIDPQGALLEDQNIHHDLFILRALDDSLEFKDLKKNIEQHKVLIRDELSFTEFYRKQSGQEDQASASSTLEFLKIINADIYIPIYQSGTLIGSITIQKGARPGHFFSDLECEKIIIFASYLGRLFFFLLNTDYELSAPYGYTSHKLSDEQPPDNENPFAS